MPKARARCATSCPMRPKPSTPSVFSYPSTPLNFDRSHAPAVSEPWACGTLRASASSMASVCSAAVITFDCGAFATTTPLFVAASTSTLSTPTPARPTTFRRSARSIRSASSVVAERIRMPSNSPMRRPSSAPSQSTPSSTSSPASRRSSTPDSPIFSLTRTFTSGGRAGRQAGFEEDPLGGRHARAQLGLVAQPAQGHLEGGHGDDDVEGAEVAAVGDAGDPALQASLPARDRDAEAVAHELRHDRPVDRLGELDRGHHVRVLVRLAAEQVEVERASRLAGGAPQDPVPLVDGLEPLPLDQPERDVERLHQADGGRERAVGRILALACHGRAPVEVVAPAGDRRGALERCLVRAREAE